MCFCKAFWDTSLGPSKHHRKVKTPLCIGEKAGEELEFPIGHNVVSQRNLWRSSNALEFAESLKGLWAGAEFIGKWWLNAALFSSPCVMGPCKEQHVSNDKGKTRDARTREGSLSLRCLGWALGKRRIWRGRQVFPEEGTLCVKGQRPERTGSALGMPRASLWWECE